MKKSWLIGIIIAFVIILIIFISLIYFFNPRELIVKEEMIDRCQIDSDCIIVPYHHCCGSTKRAINKIYLDDYNNHPDWQTFNEPICASMGMCADDSNVDSSKCENGRCVGAY